MKDDREEREEREEKEEREEREERGGRDGSMDTCISYRDVGDVSNIRDMIPDVTLIVAEGTNGIIADRNGHLPWYLPSDLKRFRKNTLGSIVIMGGNTFRSTGTRPLDGRYNIVLSRSARLKEYCRIFRQEDILVTGSIKEIIETIIAKYRSSNTPVFLMGGLQIYREFINRKFVNSVLLTRVHTDYDEHGSLHLDIADTLDLGNENRWTMVYSSKGCRGDHDTHTYDVFRYVMKSQQE